MAPLQTVGAHLVAAVQLDVGAELGEGVDVRIQASASDHVPAGRGDARPPDPREERPCEQERRADPGCQRGVELVRRQRRRMDVHLVRRSPFDLGPEVGDQLHHGLDVTDVRHVGQANGLVGQEAGGENRQSAVLVACRADRAVQGASSFDHEGLRSAALHGGHRGSLTTQWN